MGSTAVADRIRDAKQRLRNEAEQQLGVGEGNAFADVPAAASTKKDDQVAHLRAMMDSYAARMSKESGCDCSIDWGMAAEAVLLSDWPFSIAEQAPAGTQ